MSQHRIWILAAIAFSLGMGVTCGQPSARADEPSAWIDDLDIIDCHTHFYDPSRPEGVPWPSRDSSLYRTVLPGHFRALKQFRPVSGTVIVEASSRVEDNAWLLGLAADDPFIVGIIGRLPIGSTEFAMQLSRFAGNSLFRGIRVRSTRLDELLRASREDEDSLNDLRLLAEKGLALDVNGGAGTPAVVARAAEKIPRLRMVINHIGNVKVSSTPPPEDWVKGIRSAARHANVFCKISALVENAERESGAQAPNDLGFYRPYLDVVWDAFGDDRVIYASNWPVSERAADYESLQRIVFEYAAEWGENAVRNFASLNSQRAYQWVDRPGRRESSGDE
ncbi:MAG: amidohydrolase family protein [Rhodopirellula sp. JB044]|uniref:amidohydrolase family protein n=1 Tax=Rhodopirellula sp. JB044 TaxID=3342844 RepID=UPI00370AEA64